MGLTGQVVDLERVEATVGRARPGGHDEVLAAVSRGLDPAVTADVLGAVAAVRPEHHLVLVGVSDGDGGSGGVEVDTAAARHVGDTTSEVWATQAGTVDDGEIVATAGSDVGADKERLAGPTVQARVDLVPCAAVVVRLVEVERGRPGDRIDDRGFLRG